MMRRLPLLLAAAIVVIAFESRAQDLRGTARDSITGLPVSGAVVMLLDSVGRNVARTLSNDRGDFHLVVPPAARRFHVLRIGYRRFVGLIEQPARGSMTRLISLIPIPVLMPAIMISVPGRCLERSDTPRAMGLLEQARAGLLAVVAARETHPAALSRLLYRRTLDAGSDRVLRQHARVSHTDSAGVSFQAGLTPTALAKDGFASGSGAEQRFFAPDAEVLLDDAFAGAYCFRVAQPARDRTTQAGLAFSAADRVAGRVDIDGVLWIDTVARQLVDIEFRYVGLDPRLTSLRPGGHVSFRSLPDGLVLVDRWMLRLASVAYDSIWDAGELRYRIVDAVGLGESGGELARAVWPDGREWRAPLGRVRLHAVLPSGSAAAGITVRLLDAHYEARTDSAGYAELAELLPGPWSIMVQDPRLAPIEFDLPTGTEFTALRDTSIDLSFQVRTAEEETRDRCIGRRLVGGVQILGRVVDARGRPVNEARVRLMRPNGGSVLGRYETSTDGLFAFCSTVVPGSAVSLEVSHRSAASSRIAWTLAGPFTVIRAELR